MTHSRDHQHLDDLDLDDDWTGELVLTDERPDTALAGDPRDRKWMLIGLGIAGVLAAGFVIVASLGHGEAAPVQPAEPSVAIEPTDVPEPIEATPAPAPAPKLAAAPPKAKPKFVPRPRKPPPVPEQPLTTLASGTRAAVQHQDPPAAKPAPASKPAPAPVPSPPAPTLAPPSPESTAPPAGDALPDVQPWDDADDEALRDLSETSEPG